MKIMDIKNLMNDHGTNPRIQVFKYEKEIDSRILIYEGSPYTINKEIGSMKINSFTVRGAGFLEINA